MCASPVAQPQPVAITKGSQYDDSTMSKVFFSPIRYSGLLWNWIKQPNDRISQLVLKILAVPFVGCLTLVSGLLAGIGALIFSKDVPKGCLQLDPGGDITLLNRDISDEQIAEKIQEDLGPLSLQYSVQVRSLNRDHLDNNYYPENTHRYITLINPSSSATSRWWETIKYHFYDKDIANVKALYRYAFLEKTAEGLDQLTLSLKKHRSVTFLIPCDLAYARTEVG